MTHPQSQASIEAYRDQLAAARRLKGEERRNALRALAVIRRQSMETAVSSLLSAILNSEFPSDEELVWFWFNHFNVFWKKDLVSIALPDYLVTAIRPHVRGSFRDMLRATLIHPAMLVYLDNARNVAGHINENYARELLELHTLGVNGGYTQTDVQELARLLTGVGLLPKAGASRIHPLAVMEGGFMFDPRKHLPGPWQLMGKTISGKGFAAVEELLDMLVADPATAKHVAGKLAVFLLGDEPPASRVSMAAAVFNETRGNLARTVSSLLAESGAAKPSFKDPFRYVVSALRLLSAGRRFVDVRPAARWLSALGQPLFGRATPDGYSLYGRDWISSGQLVQRFDIAAQMVRIVPRLLESPVSADEVWGRPEIRRYYETMRDVTRRAISRADNTEDRLALLLSSPDFMYRQGGPAL